MSWADIDLTAGIWSKPAASTKQKAEPHVPLSAPARQLLSEIAAQQKKRTQQVRLSRHGNAGHIVRDQSGLAAHLQGRWHHRPAHPRSATFASPSQLASSGASLPLIGALLGPQLIRQPRLATRICLVTRSEPPLSAWEPLSMPLTAHQFRPQYRSANGHLAMAGKKAPSEARSHDDDGTYIAAYAVYEPIKWSDPTRRPDRRRFVYLDDHASAKDRRGLYKAVLTLRWLPPEIRSAIMTEMGRSLRAEKRACNKRS